MVQLLTAGTDEWAPHVPEHVILSTARGAHADTLAGKRVLIVGAGSIGTAVAEKRRPFGATPTLVADLQNGRLRAALDFIEPEPLPEHHLLWTSPGVIVSPHMARTVPGTNQLCYLVAVDRIKRCRRAVVDGDAL